MSLPQLSPFSASGDEPDILLFPGADAPRPRKKKRGRKNFHDILSWPDALRLIELAKRRIETAKSKTKRRGAERDLLLLLIGLYSGLRVSEICALKIEQLDCIARRLTVRHGKGDKDRCVGLRSEVIEAIREWCADRTEGFVFVMKGGRALSDRTVRWRMEVLGRAAGLKFRLHPHTMRHTAATRLLEVTRDIRMVQEFLGHENIATTMIYLHVDVSRMLIGQDLM